MRLSTWSVPKHQVGVRRPSGSMCECGRRSSCNGLIFEVHDCDKAVVHGEYMVDIAVGKNVPVKTLDELVHSDGGPATVFLRDCKWFDMGIELTPLSSPIGVDFFFSDNLAAL